MPINADILKKRYGPGVWENANGDMHFSIPELLRCYGLTDTTEHRARLTEIIKELLKLHRPHGQVVERHENIHGN